MMRISEKAKPERPACRDDIALRDLADIEKFETEKTFEERCSARSVYDVFAQSAQRYPDHIALTMIMTGETNETPRDVSYRELLEGVTRAANFFHDLAGPKPGVGWMLPNLVETHFALWGAETAGYAVPINFLLQPEYVADLLRASGAKVLVALGPHPQLDIWQKALAVSRLMPDLKLVQVAPPGEPLPEGVIGFSSALNSHDGAALGFGRPGADDEVAAYFHTGGTTGAPRLVTHTHRNQIVAAFGGAVLLDVSATDCGAFGLPLFHVGGAICCGLTFFMSGARVLVLSPGGMRNPAMVRNYWKIVGQYRATVCGGVPTALSALLGVPLDGADLSSLRFAVSGAAVVPRSVVEQFESKTGMRVHEILGMTECSGWISTAPAAADPVTGSAGYRLPYTQTSVRTLNGDGTLGEPCAPREIGVLTVSGPHVTPGYRNALHDDDAIRNGFLNSGDLAYADEDGRIYIAGRAKDLIIRGGHNIDPQMIEEAILQHPAVALAAAVGQPDKYAGELPVCYVTLKPGASTTVEELHAFGQPRIAERPAWPKRFYIVATIPMTGVGKIFKPQLREDAARRLVVQAVAETIGSIDFQTVVALGGKRGMNVNVVLPHACAAKQSEVENVLGGYHFDCTVRSALKA
jgi:fatty-acyl-CoA synthase